MVPEDTTQVSKRWTQSRVLYRSVYKPHQPSSLLNNPQDATVARISWQKPTNPLNKRDSMPDIEKKYVPTYCLLSYGYWK